MPTYTGTPNGETLNGSDGDDYIEALGGNDTVNGLGGDDLLRGGDGADTIDGGDGNDILNGGAGSDTIYGGAGNDTIDTIDRPEGLFDPPSPATRDRVDAGSGNDSVTAGHFDIVDGGEGTDNLSINFNFQSTGAVNIQVIGSLGTVSDGTTFSNFEFVDFNLTDDGDDVANIGNLRGSVNGGGGNDVITSGSANDVLYGGAGNDVLRSGDGDDQVYGGPGDDVISAGAGNDFTTVDRESNGEDSVDMGSGMDEVRVEGTTGQVRLTFTSAEVGNGGTTDANTMANQDGELAVRFQAEDANGNLIGDVSRFDDEGIQFIAGTQGITFDVRDLVSGIQRGDQFEGVVLGTVGADELTFFPPFRSSQNFYYNAGMGDDLVTAGTGNDFLVGGGGGGNDTLNAGAGNDSMLGGGGIDTLNGEAGDDMLDGGLGADVMTGGLGNDMYVVDDMGDQVVETADGGIDTVSTTLNGYILGSNLENLTLTGTANLTGTGNAGDNTLRGNSGDNTLIGGQGNDSLYGGDGNDVLNSGTGADRMYGGAGNDIYYAGVGDTIIEAENAGIDTVYASVDFILGSTLENLVLIGDRSLNGTGNNLANRMQGNDQANLLQGGRGADALYGQGGDDTLLGGRDADTLGGGAGNDTFRFDVITDSLVGSSDTIIDYGSGDRLDLSRIDANTTASGDQAFMRVDAFTGHAGEMTLAYNMETNRTTLSLDVNGDGVADAAILFIGNVNSTEGWLL